MDETVLRRLVDLVWQHATESTAVPSTTTADMLINKAFEGEVHSYPDEYGPDKPRFKPAWDIVDSVRPGVLSSSARALLVGQIVAISGESLLSDVGEFTIDGLKLKTVAEVRAEIDAWDELRKQMVCEYIDTGMLLEQAEDRAHQDIRRAMWRASNTTPPTTG